MSFKWGELICATIFLIITVLVQIKIEEDFKRKLLKVNFEQIIFKERFASEETGRTGGSKTSGTSDSISLRIPKKDSEGNYNLNDS